MRFGAVPVSEAIGLITAHTLRSGGETLRKGSPITADMAGRLRAEGVREVVAVALDAEDVGEDEAAGRLAAVLQGPNLRIEPPFTGRCNLFAEQAGVLVIAQDRIAAVNGIDEAVTVATLPAFKPVTVGEMVGTVKIIPYAVPRSVLARARAEAAEAALRVAPYTRRRVGVVSTRLPALKDSIIDKTLRVLGERLAPAGAAVAVETRVAHTAEAVADGLRDVAEAGADLTILFGASAIADRRDVIPVGIEMAGGRVDHLGMPVDPGNLLLLGALGTMPIIGAPGCARSPVENGFDWILHRLLADIPVGRADIVALGVGGLLMEIVSRPQPRGGGDTEWVGDA